MATTSRSDAATPPPSFSGTSEAEVLALAGNPNSGKTTLFNALTGLRRKVGNYPGVTVERVEGRMALADGGSARVIDLPGCYSLGARSEDERIARRVILGLQPGTPRPSVVLAVVDATSLKRSLYFVSQLLETGAKVVVALNMVDAAQKEDCAVDAGKLESFLGVPVVPVIARTGHGVPELREALARAAAPGRRWSLSAEGEAAVAAIRRVLKGMDLIPPAAEDGEALRLLVQARDEDPFMKRGGPALIAAVQEARASLNRAGVDRESLEAECRYAWCDKGVAAAVARPKSSATVSRSERADRILAHRLIGPVIFVAVMAVLFQAVYSWAEPFMGWTEQAVSFLQEQTAALLAAGALTDLLTEGVIAGVGNVIIFVPQIFLLFLFLTILEDLGYLARAAFLVDRLMRGAGLNGKSFVPLMSSFACAIPGIMATRAIENRRDRLVTILVAPLMSCSARLPVYALLIGAFFVQYEGLVLLSMYLLSVVAALGVAWLLRRTKFRGESSSFLLELPSYRLPVLKDVLRTAGGRAWVFVKQAGTVILAISIVLWAMSSYPVSDELEAQAAQRIEAGEDEEEVGAWLAGAQSEYSVAGRVGKAIEPVIEPLGFDWKIGVGLVASFAAREVMVSSLGISYSVGEDADEESLPLRERIQADRRPDGTRVFTPLVAISLMVFFVLACQCMSTLAVVKRETNSWRWPIFMFAYMTVLAYVGSLAVYQGGLMLGLGP